MSFNFHYFAARYRVVHDGLPNQHQCKMFTFGLTDPYLIPYPGCVVILFFFSEPKLKVVSSNNC